MPLVRKENKGGWVNMKEFYNNNADFKAYVDAYCKKYKIDVSEALTHAIVREVYLYYKERQAIKCE